MSIPNKTNNGTINPFRTLTSSGNITNEDHDIYLDASSNVVVGTLPDPTTVAGIEFYIKAVDITNGASFTTPSGLIDDVVTVNFAAKNDAYVVKSDGVNYKIF